MGYIFMIVVGAILGWLTAFVLRAENSRGLKINISAGIVGSLLTGLVIEPALVGGDLAGGSYTIGAMLAAMFGAAAFILLANMIRRQEVL
ncbi:GlsB/YeaQ/YmgE family stress response membrane protein [Aurantiacibacter poecillastricola]|uniref:GlsB/YeaQ/YmgE family stress response membrane protein n=1 Tax=Aurantiacibacter poecillastricola TaxID=3064385 RepID=UPI00273D4D31|nr:hypothetical protein [Aurantiacibacter sp. 219JJ12-13]MDP5260746.1 hypothetical protein [Aurantiacibacter sp. 219JJ12-13]